MSTVANQLLASQTFAEYQAITSTILSGGFVAHVPLAFGPDWDPRFGPQFGGFPTDVLYTGVRRNDRGEALIYGAAYFFDSSSYVEDEHSRQGTYYGQLPSPYWLRIIISKSDGSYIVNKYRDDKLIAAATGSNLRQAMIEATQSGLAHDEPAIEHEHRWSGTLMLWTPTTQMSA